MELNFFTFIFLILGGAFTGILGALLGIGGGIFLVPFLVFFAHLPMHNAVATSLVCLIAVSTAVASINLKRNLVNLRLGLTLDLSTTIGAILGGTLAGLLSGSWLMRIFGVAAFVISFVMAFKKEKISSSIATNNNLLDKNPQNTGLNYIYFDHAEKKNISYIVKNLPLGVSVSVIAGTISGLIGIGGGVIQVPILNLSCGVPIRAAAATSNFMIGFTAVASAFIYYGRGQLNPVIAGVVVLGVLIGSVTGTYLNKKIKARSIRLLFAFVLFVVAIQMLLRSFH